MGNPRAPKTLLIISGINISNSAFYAKSHCAVFSMLLYTCCLQYSLMWGIGGSLTFDVVINSSQTTPIYHAFYFGLWSALPCDAHSTMKKFVYVMYIVVCILFYDSAFYSVIATAISCFLSELLLELGVTFKREVQNNAVYMTLYRCFMV